MRPVDFAKALGVAALVLLVDVAIAIGVVYVYAAFVDTGHPQDYYIFVARWSTRIAGTTLMFVTAWICGRRRPARNAYLFALVLTAFYALLDGTSVLFHDIFTSSFALTIMLKLAGSQIGAWLAVRSRARIRSEVPL